MELYSIHRDYCGHGLFSREGNILICQVYDGYPDTGNPVITFNNHNDFIGKANGSARRVGIVVLDSTRSSNSISCTDITTTSIGRYYY